MHGEGCPDFKDISEKDVALAAVDKDTPTFKPALEYQRSIFQLVLECVLIPAMTVILSTCGFKSSTRDVHTRDQHILWLWSVSLMTAGKLTCA